MMEVIKGNKNFYLQYCDSYENGVCMASKLDDCYKCLVNNFDRCCIDCESLGTCEYVCWKIEWGDSDDGV